MRSGTVETLDEVLWRVVLAAHEKPPAADPEPERMTWTVYERNLIRARVPERYRADLRAFRSTPAVVAVRAFMADPTRVLLVLMGLRGVGKSCAAAYPLGRASGMYTLAAELSGIYRSLHYREELDRFTNAELLVVDELGREPDGRAGGEVSVLWEVVERRWAQRSKTILAANMLPKEFAERYGEHLLDRVEADGGDVILTGESLRPKRAQVGC